MRIIDADETRRIDLPDVGPCPRPVDIDQRMTGFSRLKSLRIYRFAPNTMIEGESEEDEVFVLPVSGEIDLAVTGRYAAEARLGSEGPRRALYMTRDHAYRLTPRTEAAVAYARAASVGRVPVRVVKAQCSEGLAEALSYRLVKLAEGEDFVSDRASERLVHVAAGRLRAGETELSAGQTLALGPDDTVGLTAVAPSRLLVVAA